MADAKNNATMTQADQEEERRRREEEEARRKAEEEVARAAPAKSPLADLTPIDYFGDDQSAAVSRVIHGVSHLGPDSWGGEHAAAKAADMDAADARLKEQMSTRLRSQADMVREARQNEVVVGGGARLSDDRSWEKDYEAMLQRKAAARAGRQAAADERARLLATGRYFDDGRGNIKLKKEFREYKRPVAQGGRIRYYNETRADDGSAARAMEAASRAAYDNAVNGMVVENRKELDHVDFRKAMSGVQQAKGNLQIYNGLAAAFDSLNNSEAVEDLMVAPGTLAPNGMKKIMVNGQEREVDAKWDYDEFGRIKGQAQNVAHPSLKVRSGFVGKGVINAINQQLQSLGDGRRITGIIARQTFNPDFPEKKQEPMFYIQGVRVDPKTGASVPFGQTYSRKDAYMLGKASGKEAGFGQEYSDGNIIGTWGDVFGVAAAQNARAEAAKAPQNFKDVLDLQKFRLDQSKFKADLYNKYMMANGKDNAAQAIFKQIPTQAWDAMLAPVPVLDAEGNPVMNDMGEPATRPRTIGEVMTLMGKIADWGKQRFSQSDEVDAKALMDFVFSSSGITPPQAAAPDSGGAQQAQVVQRPPTREEELLAKKAELQRVQAERSAGSASSASSQTSVRVTQPTASEGAAPAPVSSQASPSVFSMEQENARRAANGRAQSSPSWGGGINDADSALYGKELLSEMRKGGAAGIANAPKGRYTAPLSETKLQDFPAAFMAKLGRSYAAGVRAQEESRRAELAAADRMSDAAANWAAEDIKKTGRALRAAGEATPLEVVDAIKAASDGSVRRYLQDEKDRRTPASISPRNKPGAVESAVGWINNALDFFRKANGQEAEVAAQMKSLIGQGKDKALAVIRAMMEEDGVDTSDVTPDSPTGNLVFDRLLEMTSPFHAARAGLKKGKAGR